MTNGEDCQGSVSPTRELREEEDRAEEGRSVAREIGARPARREAEERNLDDAVFRAWCPRCVRGRAEAYPHRADEREKDVPIASVDYMYMHSEQSKEEEKGMPIMVVKDSRTKYVVAKVVAQKGVCEYAIVSLKKAIEQLGYKKVILRSDNEPAILALKEAVRRETDVEIVSEEVPVGDHQANGSIENAVKQVQGQFRAIKDAFETSYRTKLTEESPMIPWTVMHSGSVISRVRKDQEGFTAYSRWKGRDFGRPVAEFGECVLFPRADAVGVNKLDSRWEKDCG